MVSVHRVGNKGLLVVGGRELREANIEESRLRRETLKLSLALSLKEAIERMGLTKSEDCSAVKSCMVTILSMKMALALTVLLL